MRHPSTSSGNDQVGQRTPELVDATVRENLWAGAGAGVLVFSASWGWCAFVGTPLMDYHLLASILSAGATFGLLSVYRFSMDEIRDGFLYAKQMALLTDQAADIARLTATIAEQQVEISRLRNRVRGDEFKAASKNARDIVVPTETDAGKRLRNAERILERWQSGNPFGRDYVQMSREDWQAAMSLLHSAGAAGRGGNGGRQWVIIAKSHAEALRAIRQRANVWEDAAGTTFVPN